MAAIIAPAQGFSVDITTDNTLHFNAQGQLGINLATANTWTAAQSFNAGANITGGSLAPTVLERPTQDINPNLLFNSSAEFGLAGWTPSGTWSTQLWFEWSPAFVFATASASGTLTSQSIPISAGATLTISGWVYNGGGGAAATVTVNALNSSGTVIGAVATLSLAAGQSWSYLSATGTTPANTAAVQVVLSGTGASTNPAVEFARLKLEPGSVPTPYSQEADTNWAQWGSAVIDALLQSGATIPSGQTLQVNGTINNPTLTGTITAQSPITANQGIAGLASSLHGQSPIRPNLVVDPLWRAGAAWWNGPVTGAPSGVLAYNFGIANDPDAWPKATFNGYTNNGSSSVNIALSSYLIPATAGEYFSASVLCAFGPGSSSGVSANLQIQFYNSSKAIVGSSATQLPMDGGHHTGQVIGAQAPTNTAFVDLVLFVTVPAGATFNGGWWAFPKLEKVESSTAVPTLFVETFSAFAGGALQLPTLASPPPTAGAVSWDGSALRVGSGSAANPVLSHGAGLEVTVLPLTEEIVYNSGSVTDYYYDESDAASASGSASLFGNLQQLSAVWAGATYYFEVTLLTNNTSGYTVYAGLWDYTANALVSGSTVSTTAATPTVIRSGPLSLTAGHIYALALWSSSSSSVAAIAYAARVLAVI